MDFLFISITFLFFIIAVAYVYACNSLKGGGHE